MHGNVKWFDPRKGYGWLVPSDGEDVFVHASEIVGETYNELIQDELVEFDMEVTPKGRAAKNVRRVNPRLLGRVKRFEFGKGFICGDDGSDIFVHRNDIITDAEVKRLVPGELVEYARGIDSKGRPQAVRVRRLDPRPPLLRFAAIEDIEASLEQLKELAATEPWQYINKPDPRYKYPILYNYLFNTFARLEEEGKIATAEPREGRRIACFNTGLATPAQEAIFALLEARRTHAPDPRVPAAPWTLKGFFKESDRQLTPFGKRPDMASYFSDPKQLLFDVAITLVNDIDHIIGPPERGGNRDRFPEDVRTSEFTLRSALDGAIEAAKRRVRRNYKAAIPQFYRGKVQLLLPLCMRKPEVADLALVIEREGEVYRGSTVLTLDMAYNNARQIARPDREWLDWT